MTDIIKYATTRLPGRRPTKEASAQRDELMEKYYLAGLEVEGTVALGGRIMDRLVDLNEHRLEHADATGDHNLGLMLMEIQANTVRQAKKIQNGVGE